MRLVIELASGEPSRSLTWPPFFLMTYIKLFSKSAKTRSPPKIPMQPSVLIAMRHMNAQGRAFRIQDRIERGIVRLANLSQRPAIANCAACSELADVIGSGRSRSSSSTASDEAIRMRLAVRSRKGDCSRIPIGAVLIRDSRKDDVAAFGPNLGGRSRMWIVWRRRTSQK